MALTSAGHGESFFLVVLPDTIRVYPDGAERARA
jgi:hypothetical protein